VTGRGRAVSVLESDSGPLVAYYREPQRPPIHRGFEFAFVLLGAHDPCFESLCFSAILITLEPKHVAE
jgi:hypothetical protein